MAKCTSAESKIREETIHEMLLDGHSRYAIIRFCAEEWKIKSRQVDKYIRKVNDRIEAIVEKDIDFRRKLAIRRCQRFRIKCEDEGKLATAAKMLKEINDIEGVKVKRITVDARINDHTKENDEMLEISKKLSKFLGIVDESKE